MCQNNSVLLRLDGFAGDFEKPNRSINWSVNSGLLHHFLDVPLTPNNRYHQQIPVCTTAQAVANAIGNYSEFSSPSCRLTWYTPTDICHIISKYSLIWFDGDWRLEVWWISS